MHLAAAPNHRHIGRHIAVDERAAAPDERELAVDRQVPGEVKGAGPDFMGHTSVSKVRYHDRP
jgi:hypothetical protein